MRNIKQLFSQILNYKLLSKIMNIFIIFVLKNIEFKYSMLEN
jgi:hypothetical protein